MTDPGLTSVPYIEGLTAGTDDQIKEYIGALYPDRFVSGGTIATIEAVAAAGVVAAVVGAGDAFSTWQANNHSVDEFRNNARREMEAATTRVLDALETNPDEIHEQVCVEGAEYVNCFDEVYEVRSQDGVVRFTLDMLTSPYNDLSEEQTDILVDSLPSEPSGARSEAFDESVANGLNEATNAYVASVPDRQRELTNASTGEMLLGGSTLALMAIGVSYVLERRLKAQRERVSRANISLAIRSEYGWPYNDDGEREARLALGFRWFEGRSRYREVFAGISEPLFGGARKREKTRVKVKEAVAAVRRSEDRAS